MAFDPTVFVDVPEDEDPPPGAADLDASELNKLGQGIRTVDLRVDAHGGRLDAVEAAIATGDGGGALGPGTVTDTHVATNAAISLDKTADSATRLAMTAAERTKLDAVAAGATTNSTDAQLRDRATHTGTQAISTVIGLQAALDERQPVDGDLTALAGLGDGVPVRSGGTWSAVDMFFGPASFFYPETYGAAGNGTTNDAVALQNCINAARTANGVVWLKPSTTYLCSSALTWPTTGTQVAQIEGNGATINFASVGAVDCLALGTLDPDGQVLTTGGYVRRLRVVRGLAEDSNAQAPTDYKAGIVWNSTRHARTEDCYVNNVDIGYDLRGNCYGAKFRGCRVGVTSNVGLLLRGGTGAIAGSGSDIEIAGFWGGGAKSAFWMEGNAGGYWFYGCKPGGGHHGFTNAKDHFGLFLVGPTYEPVTTVVGAVSAGASTITVADGSKITGSSVLIGGNGLNDTLQEIVVSSKSGNVLTVPTSGAGRVVSAITAGTGVRNIGGGVANVAVYGGGIEGTTRIHAVRLYADCADLSFTDFSFNSNGPTTGAQGNQMIQVLKHSRGGSPAISFRRCLVQGSWIGATPITLTQTNSFSPQLFEEMSAHGGGQAPSFNGVTMDLTYKSMSEWSDTPDAFAITPVSITLAGARLFIDGGALKYTGWNNTTTTVAPS